VITFDAATSKAFVEKGEGDRLGETPSRLARVYARSCRRLAK